MESIQESLSHRACRRVCHLLTIHLNTLLLRMDESHSPYRWICLKLQKNQGRRQGSEWPYWLWQMALSVVHSLLKLIIKSTGIVDLKKAIYSQAFVSRSTEQLVKHINMNLLSVCRVQKRCDRRIWRPCLYGERDFRSSARSPCPMWTWSTSLAIDIWNINL